MNCKKCSAELVGNSTFCGECGAKIPKKRTKSVKEKTTVYCGECGSTLKEGNDFCAKCGTKTAKVENPTAVEPDLPKEMISKCSVCGVVATAGNTFCGECGGKIEQVEKTEEVVVPQPVQVVLPVPQLVQPVVNMQPQPAILPGEKSSNGKVMLVVIALLIIGAGVYFFFGGSDDKTDGDDKDKQAEKNGDNKKEEEIPLEDKYFTININSQDNYLFMYEKAMNAHITLESNYYGSDQLDTMESPVALKVGSNEILVGKDSNNQDIWLHIYLLAEELSTGRTEVINNLISEIEQCDYWTECGYIIRQFQLSSEMTNGKAVENEEYDEGEFFKCEKSECIDITTFKQYIASKYKTSQAYASWFMESAIDLEMMKIENGELYFAMIPVMGFTESYSFNYVSHFESGDHITILTKIVEDDLWGNYEPTEQGYMVISFVRENGQYLLEKHIFIGNEFKIN